MTSFASALQTQGAAFGTALISVSTMIVVCRVAWYGYRKYCYKETNPKETNSLDSSKTNTVAAEMLSLQAANTTERVTALDDLPDSFFTNVTTGNLPSRPKDV